MIAFIALFIIAFLAGIQNALAGGGSFLTFPALMFTGLDARAANITSTVALFPGQVALVWPDEETFPACRTYRLRHYL